MNFFLFYSFRLILGEKDSWSPAGQQPRMSLSGGPEAVQDLDPTPHMPHSKPLVVLLVVVRRWKGDVPGARELGWLQVGRLPTYPPPAPFRVRSVSERP